jgi:hypothetical protein
VLLAELRHLLGRGLVAEDGVGRVARHQLDEQRDQRDDRPDDEQKDDDAARDVEQLVLHPQKKKSDACVLVRA